MSNIYKDAGVDVNNSNQAVDDIKAIVKSTQNKGSNSNLSSFGATFDLTKYNIADPVLIAGTDGVGTKILLSIEAKKYDGIGIDLVAMCANDILASGAKPLFFLDYYASAKLDNNTFKKVVQSVATGCIQADMALIGGENAEMPDMVPANHFDLVGNAVGVASKAELEAKTIKPGQKVIGIKSNGLHSNGYSLVRKICFKDNNLKLSDEILELGNITLAEELLKPTRIYVKDMQKIEQVTKVHSAVHITGGGYFDNFVRITNQQIGLELDLTQIKVPNIFKYLASLANVPLKDLFDVLNMGIGFAVVVDENDAEQVLALSEDYVLLGSVTDSGKVEIKYE